MINHMFDSIRVVHSLPGRTRLQVESSARPASIEGLVRSLPYVYSATYTRETGSVLVYHDVNLSFRSLKTSLTRFCLTQKKKEHKSTFSWKQLTPIAVCTGVFLTNWYIQRSPFALAWKTVSHWTAIAASICTSFWSNKRWNIESFFTKQKANANTLTAASIFASIYTGNPGSALVITIMSMISELLTEYTSEQTKQYIHSVLKLDTTYAWRVNEQRVEEKKVALENLQVGDIVVVFTGEKIPVDGVVLEGNGAVDESSITGEYMPKEVGENEQVYAGSIMQKRTAYHPRGESRR
ncbi:hypothetical protein GCM10020331_000180 [Ectobacillus funiculus]